MDPELPENEKDEGGHRNLVELRRVHGNDLPEALDQGGIDLKTDVSLERVHARSRRAVRKRNSYPGVRRTSVIVSDQETSHPANGIPDGEGRGTEVRDLPEWQGPPLDLDDDEKNRSGESPVPHHSAP